MIKVKKSVRIAELESLIVKARNEYYNSQPTISDQLYDTWVDELAQLKPDSTALTSIGAPPVSEWKKVTHSITMGSLDKINTEEELADWRKVAPKQTLLVTEKLDGMSVHLQYDSGKLVLAATRGSGLIGEDITVNVVKMQGVQKTLKEDFTGSIRGEIVLTKTDHQKFFPEYSSPRNAASGIAKRLDGTGVEHLTVICYKVVDGKDFATEGMQFKWLERMGFKTPSWSVTNDPQKVWDEYQAGKRDQLDYDIDGLVLTINDTETQLELGEKDGRPQGSIAYKFSAITRESVLRDIVWQVGAAGRVCPVGIFDSVNILGANITNASLYNHGYIKEIGLDIGATILVARANDIIPKIISVIKSPTKSTASAPEECPVCGAETVMEGEYLICPNTATCPAQISGRVQRYVGTLDILEWGDKLIENLVESGLVEDVSDLYTLTEEDLLTLDRMGERSAQKVLETLWAKNPVPLDVLLGALSIPLCGPTMIRLVMDAGFDTWDKIKNAKQSQLENIPGFGPAKSQAIVDWVESVGNELVPQLFKVGVKVKEKIMGNLTGKSFCFTGAMEHKRNELELMVTEAGGVVKSSVGKGLSYLVIADPNSTSGKAVAARKNGTTCISEQTFLDMVG